MINIHYIYVNKHDKYDRSIPSEISEIKRNYDRIHSGNGKIHIYGYDDIYDMLKSYDEEFAYYFNLIDPIFSNVISNVGRVLCLYLEGGIYHDVNWYIKSKDYYNKMDQLLLQDVVVFERHPKLLDWPVVIRSSNMAAGKPGNWLLKKILLRLKTNLHRMYLEIKEKPDVRHGCWKETGISPIIDELVDSCREILERETSCPRDLHDLYRIASVTNDLAQDDYRINSNGKEIFLMYFFKHLKNMGKFYNKNQKDHWSYYQKEMPILKLK